MKLRKLLTGVPIQSSTADLETEITGVSYDSRATKPGDLFVAMTGFATDGHKYIGTALEKGAAAVLCQQLPAADCAYIQTADSRRALAVIGANWFGHPAKEMTMIAVTGTCGKTTTTYLLKAILEQAKGAKVGLIGTNQNMIGQEIIPTERTT
ncbi:MAG: UDP-N-acetylmuramoyl-L-alanyl-D-glutamate--2,6-diaminopimelate ligase, partial [Clostridiales bacterium]|nr:UDP-N-acetylmuramoyl-L-alanyl-D-glutamate--2,6-diaminopimelate ligase [Clostridiales bacterium]